MGAAASLTEHEQAEIVQKLRSEFDARFPDATDEEKELELYRHLREEFSKMEASADAKGESGGGGAAQSKGLGTQLSEAKLAEAAASHATRVPHELSADTHAVFSVGDVVKAKPMNDSLFYEGVVVNMPRAGVVEVSWSEEHAEEVPLDRVRKVRSWEDVENRDGVLVREAGSFLQFQAIVTAVNLDGTFDVVYDDGEEEQAVERERLVKVDTARMRAQENWRKARQSVMAMLAFRGGLSGS